jgi:hypothetical protein
MDNNTSTKHVKIELFIKSGSNWNDNSHTFGTKFVYPSSNTNFMGFVTISNTLGAEFSNIIDNYKPKAWSTQYWFNYGVTNNKTVRVDNFKDSSDYFDVCLESGKGYGTNDCPIVIGHVTRF